MLHLVFEPALLNDVGVQNKVARSRHELSRLTVEEAAVYDDLRFDRLQPRLRLEQERIGFGLVRDQLAPYHHAAPDFTGQAPAANP